MTPAAAQDPAMRRAVSLARRQARSAGQSPATLIFVTALRVLGAATGSVLAGPTGPLLAGVGAGVPALTQGRVRVVVPLGCGRRTCSITWL